MEMLVVMGKPMEETDSTERNSRAEGVEWSGRYVVVKALQDGVVIMGLTRGADTRSHHSERLDAGEVLIAQFTKTTAAIKVRGRAQVLTDVGLVESGT
jgi:transcription attenuation protein (tryptophan RNA-binding attenuator protein)